MFRGVPDYPLPVNEADWLKLYNSDKVDIRSIDAADFCHIADALSAFDQMLSSC